MDLARPFSTVSPSVDGDVLAVLARTKEPMTGREVAGRVGKGRSHGGVRLALKRLVRHGVVDQREAGRALLFTLNREHLAYPAIRILADLRLDLIERLRSRIESWPIAPVHASLFGSAARGDGDAESDVDLFLICPTLENRDQESEWEEQVHGLAQSLYAWTGNHAGAISRGMQDLDRLHRDGAQILDEMARDSIALYGPPLANLIGDLK